MSGHFYFANDTPSSTKYIRTGQIQHYHLVPLACQMAHAVVLCMEGFVENQLYKEQAPCLNITIKFLITTTMIIPVLHCHSLSLLIAPCPTVSVISSGEPIPMMSLSDFSGTSRTYTIR